MFLQECVRSHLLNLSDVYSVWLPTGPEKKSMKTIDVRHDMDLRETFSTALGNMKPDEHQEMPGVDAPWYA